MRELTALAIASIMAVALLIAPASAQRPEGIFLKERGSRFSEVVSEILDDGAVVSGFSRDPFYGERRVSLELFYGPRRTYLRVRWDREPGDDAGYPVPLAARPGSWATRTTRQATASGPR